jgi:hypothetical protein
LKLILIKLEQGLILFIVTDIHWGLWLGGALPRGLWGYGDTPCLIHDLPIIAKKIEYENEFQGK